MQRFQKWNFSWCRLKNSLLILLLLSPSAIALHVLSVSAGSNIPMQLALNRESETERAMPRPTPILIINKDDEPPDSVQSGAVLTYMIAYSNVGDAKAKGVLVTDTFDHGVTFEGSWPNPTGGARNVRYWEVGDLHKSDHGNITASVIVSTSAVSGTVLTNLVQIDSPDAEMASSTETTTVSGPPMPILSISKEDEPSDNVQPGAVLTYTITYSNVGDAKAKGVIVTDTSDHRVTFEGSWPSPTGGAGNVRYWEVGDLHKSDHGNITASVIVSTSAVSGTVLTNLVQIGSPDAEMASSTETTTVSGPPMPILSISKDDEPPDNVLPGAVLTYTIAYSNVGDAKAKGVIVTDTFDHRVTFEGSWPSPTGGAGNVRYWEVGDLHKSDHGNITASVIVSTSAVSGTVLTNLVQIGSPDAEMASSTETTTVLFVKRYAYLPIITKSYPKSMFEGFEAGVVPPSGWALIQTNPNQTWELDTVQLTPHSGSYYAAVKYDPALLDQDELLLSPAFTSGTGRVSLWSFGSLYWCRNPYDNCDLEVWFVNGAWGGGDDVLLGKADDDWTSSYEWSYSTFDFSPYASGNPARIALRYVGNDGAKIGVDDILIIY